MIEASDERRGGLRLRLMVGLGGLGVWMVMRGGGCEGGGVKEGVLGGM